MRVKDRASHAKRFRRPGVEEIDGLPDGICCEGIFVFYLHYAEVVFPVGVVLLAGLRIQDVVHRPFSIRPLGVAFHPVSIALWRLTPRCKVIVVGCEFVAEDVPVTFIAVQMAVSHMPLAVILHMVAFRGQSFIDGNYILQIKAVVGRLAVSLQVFSVVSEATGQHGSPRRTAERIRADGVGEEHSLLHHPV